MTPWWSATRARLSALCLPYAAFFSRQTEGSGVSDRREADHDGDYVIARGGCISNAKGAELRKPRPGSAHAPGPDVMHPGTGIEAVLALTLKILKERALYQVGLGFILR